MQQPKHATVTSFWRNNLTKEKLENLKGIVNLGKLR